MVVDKIKSFNMIIESFLAQTSELVGTTYYNNFKRIIKVNSLIGIEKGIKCLIPHKDQIFNKDESYFVDEKNYIEKINNIDNPVININKDSTLSEILRLKEVYYKLDPESRENVWSILQALLQLVIEYCEIKNINVEEYCL
jgi:hypothetical protein